MDPTAGNENHSPFFFENSDKYTDDEYFRYFELVSENNQKVLKYAVNDLHYFSRVLAIKYRQIRWAYQVYMAGILLSLGVLIILMIIHEI